MQKRKGFTLVELVIVIAVIAILAGVLIGTFASVINRANDSAKMQEIKAAEHEQKAEDLLKKIEDSNWYGWEDFEASIVEKITAAYNKNPSYTLTTEDINRAVTKALEEYAKNNTQSNTGLTEEQVKAIVENAFGSFKFEGVTEAQVRTIVAAAASSIQANQLTVSQVKSIVSAANANNLTQADVASIIAQAGLATETNVNTAVKNILSALNSPTSGIPSKDDIANIIVDLLPVTKKATSENFDELVEHLNSTSTIILDSSLGALELDTTRTVTLYIKSEGYTGNLTINAPNADIILVGDFANVIVTEVADYSLHILNKVTGTLTINSGRVVLEAGADVATVKAAPKPYATVRVVVEKEAKISQSLLAEYQTNGDTTRDYIVIENSGSITGAKLTTVAGWASNTNTTNVTVSNYGNATGTTTTTSDSSDTDLLNKIDASEIENTYVPAPTIVSTNKVVTATYSNGSVKQLSLDEFRNEINNGAIITTAVLTADVDITNKPWAPIGTWEYPYNGTFDGQGHTIIGLTKTDGGAGAVYTNNANVGYGETYGFFGIVGNGDVVIKNLTFTDVNINLTKGKNVGTLIGYAPCNDDFSSSKSSAPKKWENNEIVGTNSVTIDNVVVASGSITGSSHVGGIVGKHYSSGLLSFSSCTNNATLVCHGGGCAGIVAMMSNSAKCLTVIDCTNNGNITNDGHSAGIVADGHIKETATIINCLNTGTITSTDKATSSDHAAVGIARVKGIKTIANNLENTGAVTNNGTSKKVSAVLFVVNDSGTLEIKGTEAEHTFIKNSGTITGTIANNGEGKPAGKLIAMGNCAYDSAFVDIIDSDTP